MIKGLFSINYLKSGGREALRNNSRNKKSKAAIWQRRFWEHTIRDDKDFKKHFDYIHYNPVKHDLVENVKDWPYSTFLKYVRKQYYPIDWGGIEMDDDEMNKFGE